MNRFSSSLSIAAMIAMTVVGAKAQILPVAVTGFNVDAIYGGGMDGTNGDVGGPGGTGYQYVSETYAAANPTVFYSDPGLPSTGTVVSGSGSGATFQFAPYTADNVLAVRGSNLTLTLSTPAAFSKVSFLLNNLTYNANETQSFVLNFAGGSTATLTTADTIPYWVNGSPSYSSSTQSAGVAATYQPLTYGSGASSGHDGTPIQFDEYDFVVPTADQGKILDSITVVGLGSTNPLDVYAVSGVVAPEPSTWAMLLGGVGVLLFAGRLRRVSSL